MSRLFGYLRPGLILALAFSGCRTGVGKSVATVVPVGNPCYVEASGMPLRDTITVALPGPIRPGGAHLSLSPAERFLAAHLSRDSVFLDCTGRATASSPGAYRIASSEPLTLVPTKAGGSGPTILVQVAAPGSDPRDLIDRGAEVVITSDAAALEYARSRGDLRLVPLAWSTTYALLSPPGSPLPIEPTFALRIELARDAVRAEARPAEPLTRWNDSMPCHPQRQQASTPIAAIVYPEQDATARALAERLVALAGAGGPRRVIGYAPAAFDSALAGGRATAYVLPLPRLSPPDCSALPPVPSGSRIAFLIDLRPTAVLRPGVPPFSIGGDGLIRFVPGPVP